MTPQQHPSDEAATPISPCTNFKVRSLARLLSQLYDETLAPSGLRSTQYGLIAHARRPRGGTPPSVSELAAILFTDRTTLTRNLGPLVAAGYLRLESGGDARSKAVVVTAEGEAAYRRARALWKTAQARVREVAGVRQVGELEALVDRMLPRFAREGSTR